MSPDDGWDEPCSSGGIRTLCVAGQAVAVYSLCLLWFFGAVTGVWKVVLSSSYGFAHGDGSSIPGGHTLLVLAGLGVGQSLHQRRAEVLVLCAVSFLFTTHHAVRWYPGLLSAFGALPGEHTTFLTSFSLTMWFTGAMALAPYLLKALPSSVSHYTTHFVVFYLIAAVYFGIVCFPLWNLWGRFAVATWWGKSTPYPEVTEEVTFRVGLARVAGSTHALSLLLGMVNEAWVRTHARISDTVEFQAFVTTISCIFTVAMYQWISYALNTGVEHVEWYAVAFFGKECVGETPCESLKSIISISYGMWFTAGVLFERSRETTPSSPSPSSDDEEHLHFSRPLHTLVVGASAFFLASLLVVPLTWPLALVLLGFLLFLPWPKSTIHHHDAPPDDHLPASLVALRWLEAIQDCPRTNEQYLVFGTGTVSVKITECLIQRGETRVRVFASNTPEPIEGVEYVFGDLVKLDDVTKACRGVSTVFAVLDTMRYGDRSHAEAMLSYSTSVLGAINVARACIASGVRYMIYQSSCLATLNASHEGLNESAMYADRHSKHYGRNKAEAERIMLRANGQNGIKCTVIRPGVVFGPQDETLFEMYMKHNTGFILQPNFTCDFVYVDNVALGHLKAEARLRDNTPGVAGEVFCIGNAEPMTHAEFGAAISRHRPSIRMFLAPRGLTQVLAYGVVAIHWLFGGSFRLPPPVDSITPTALAAASIEYTLDDSKARRVLGYHPVFSVNEGIKHAIDMYMLRAARTELRNLEKAAIRKHQEVEALQQYNLEIWGCPAPPNPPPPPPP
eukprot:Sspe_Gene.105744::Locus_82801_Transcript_1_1_Confidence_1.000_Length_2394::g.105744::m.105744/K07748/E1.1.1.170, NSDHL, ERG26; sterol-4alpha-carboxylate 3-dehydrogenase (decarboxylating)